MEELKTERKSLYGIRYNLKLIREDTPNVIPIRENTVDPNIWWVLEYAPESERMSRWAGGAGFLWFDTRSLTKHSLKQKYDECDMRAIMHIQNLLANYHKRNTMFILNEVKFYLYSVFRLLPHVIRYRWEKMKQK